MNETEWMNWTDPSRLLGLLRGRVSERKLRLFAVACVRGTFWSRLTDPMKGAVEVAEHVADGQGSKVKLGSALHDAWLAVGAINLAGRAARAAASPLAWDAGADVLWTMKEAVGLGELDAESVSYSVHVLRCIFGNPFRPRSISPAVLIWHDTIVAQLAQGIYDDRAFDRLPVLADALVEAGCSDPDILDHLRGQAPHCRGCWPLDLLLGRS